MSDWFRRDRDEQGRYGSESRERREFGGQDRWRDQDRRPGEQRSFDEHRPDPARGGHTGESFGGPDFMRQERGGQYYRGEAYGQQGQDYDQRSEDWRRGYGQEQQRFGQSSQGGQRWGGEQRYGQQGYGGQQQRFGQQQGYGAEQQRFDQQNRYGEQQRYGVQGVSGAGMNPQLQRVSDGEADQGWRANMGMGEHRGRGPKNYTRSDERIREDINDRLSDDSWLDASEIEVQVTKCEVMLTGTVHSREDKRRAEDIAEQVSGVKHVQNNLRVEPQSAQRMTSPGAGGSIPPVT